MSKEQANEFLKKLYTDKATAEKFQEAFRALVVKTGNDAGFKFTADDLKAALAEAKTGELSEDALMVIDELTWQSLPGWHRRPCLWGPHLGNIKIFG